MNNRRYCAPSAEAVEILPKSIILASGLEDYEDNPIFKSASEPESLFDRISL